jgi:hypothetical protein
MAMYECADCKAHHPAPRLYWNHFGQFCRCPMCGSFKAVRLKRRDRVDAMNTGFLHLLERLFGGKLYHCRFCRVQFYDRREPAPPRENSLVAEVQRAAQ